VHQFALLSATNAAMADLKQSDPRNQSSKGPDLHKRTSTPPAPCQSTMRCHLSTVAILRCKLDPSLVRTSIDI
jgi:hypothetical protein